MATVYPGTFDPFTNGHLDVVRRARALFGRLTVAVARGGKKRPAFALAERCRMIRRSLDAAGVTGVGVEGFDGALVDYLKARRARVVVRGLRSFSDFDYEFQMALFNRRLEPDVETVFVLASPELAAINSGLVREVAAMGRDVSGLVPAPVAEVLLRRRGKRA
ncbi:MAG TPA: pantetheine-phosphate adenylyltransferase [Planctomycetota bacterium]|nr:pantetheine-phosphate adenylyltransferase [Planctomycetota bacterium]